MGVAARRLQQIACSFFAEQGAPSTIAENRRRRKALHTSSGTAWGWRSQEPRLYRRSHQRRTLRPGHVFTVEPGSLLPGPGLWSRLEDVVWIDERGRLHNLTPLPKGPGGGDVGKGAAASCRRPLLLTAPPGPAAWRRLISPVSTASTAALEGRPHPAPNQRGGETRALSSRVASTARRSISGPGLQPAPHDGKLPQRPASIPRTDPGFQQPGDELHRQRLAFRVFRNQPHYASRGQRNGPSVTGRERRRLNLLPTSAAQNWRESTTVIPPSP